MFLVRMGGCAGSPAVPLLEFVYRQYLSDFSILFFKYLNMTSQT